MTQNAQNQSSITCIITLTLQGAFQILLPSVGNFKNLSNHGCVAVAVSVPVSSIVSPLPSTLASSALVQTKCLEDSSANLWVSVSEEIERDGRSLTPHSTRPILLSAPEQITLETDGNPRPTGRTCGTTSDMRILTTLVHYAPSVLFDFDRRGVSSELEREATHWAGEALAGETRGSLQSSEDAGFFHGDIGVTTPHFGYFGMPSYRVTFEGGMDVHFGVELNSRRRRGLRKRDDPLKFASDGSKSVTGSVEHRKYGYP